MKEKLLRELAAKSILILLGTGTVSYGLGTASVVNASFGNNVQVNENRVISLEEAKSEVIEKSYKNLETGVIVNQLAEPYLIIEKPEAKSYELSIKEKYMERSLKVYIKGLEEKAFGRRNLWAGGEADSCLKKVELSYDYDPESFAYTAVYELELDAVYGYQLYEDEEAVYIELWEPAELYQRILVVDAGHGGNDIGTYSPDMEYYEKDINLGIVTYLKEFLEQEDIKVYYTRLKDEKVYLNPRIDLANEVKADFMISIHCNSSEASSASGCEVLYGSRKQKESFFDSKALAAICLRAMTENGSLKQRGLVANDEIYIIGKAKVPVALIETGFMSNEGDLRYLTEKENQKQIAESIYRAVLEAFSELEQQ